MNTQKLNISKILPVLIGFFVMGFVDLVGIATNYVKADFHLTDTMANLLPSMVFLWFLVFSVPTGLLMNKIGRKNTVLISLIITLPALLIPIFIYSFASMLISFTLLGIGNAMMQVSLNPLLANIVDKKRMASTLTFGQFIKAIASFVAPILAAWAVVRFLNWRMMVDSQSAEWGGGCAASAWPGTQGVCGHFGAAGKADPSPRARRFWSARPVRGCLHCE